MVSGLKRNKFFIYLLDLCIFSIFLPALVFSRKRRKKESSFRNILIIELWGIGDLVMMSPILKLLRESYPQAKISLLSKSYGQVLFGGCGYVDKIIAFDFYWTHFKDKYNLWKWDWAALLRTLRGLRKEKFDLILDARGDIRNNLLSFLIYGRRRIGYSWTGGGYFLTDNLFFDKNRHRVECWSNMIAHLGIKIDNLRPYIRVCEDAQKRTLAFLEEYNVKDEELLVGIHPGAAVKIRCWPLDKFAKVASYLRDNHNAKIVVFVEPEGYAQDIPINGEFIKARVSLPDLIALIKRCNFLICNDSGAMHLAAALERVILAIFGPGDIRRIGPYPKESVTIIQRDIKCRPCFDECKYASPVCLESIEIKEVVNSIELAIRNRAALPNKERVNS